jgi:hypothetical protein
MHFTVASIDLYPACLGQLRGSAVGSPAADSGNRFFGGSRDFVVDSNETCLVRYLGKAGI